jgi:hypothetical protein
MSPAITSFEVEDPLMQLERLFSKPVPGHYTLHTAENTFTYCYIRKNASTAFKRFFVGESRYAKKYDNENPLAFMGRYHATVRSDLKKQNAVRLVVIRDPVARLISLFLNKFVIRDGNRDIFESYHRVTGKDPNETTFLDFVRDYIARYDFNEIDCHALPQVEHLQPVVYNAPVRFEHLYEDIRLALGGTLAERYFAHKTNKTVYGDESESTAGYLASPQQLARQYQETGALPNPKAFYCDELFAVVNKKYRVDQLVFEKLNQDCQLLGGEKLPELEIHLDL